MKNPEMSSEVVYSGKEITPIAPKGSERLWSRLKDNLIPMIIFGVGGAALTLSAVSWFTKPNIGWAIAGFVGGAVVGGLLAEQLKGEPQDQRTKG